jgi:hypothetical protein
VLGYTTEVAHHSYVNWHVLGSDMILNLLDTSATLWHVLRTHPCNTQLNDIQPAKTTKDPKKASYTIKRIATEIIIARAVPSTGT